MKRLIGLGLMVLLAACTDAERRTMPDTAGAVVMEAAPSVADCGPDDGDGIGGTGCPALQ